MAKIVISLGSPVKSTSSDVSKSAIMAVFNRRADSNAITKRVAANMEKYIDSHARIVTKAIEKHGTAAKVAESLYLIKYGKPMPKAGNIESEDKNRSGVEKRWTDFCKKEKLHTAVKQAGLDMIKNRRANPHDKGKVEDLKPEQIWNVASEHARGKY